MGPTSHVEATSWYAIFPTYATRSDKLVRHVTYFQGKDGCDESLTGAPTTCINDMIERSMTKTRAGSLVPSVPADNRRRPLFLVGKDNAGRVYC